jgi:hypothetical protein
VFAWGGGPLVLREFHASQAALRSDPGSQMGVLPPAWHIWRAERPVAPASAPAASSAAGASSAEVDAAAQSHLVEQSAMNDVFGTLRIAYD